MNSLKYRNLLAVGILSFTASVQAGTMGPVSVPTWDGLYTSGQLGDAWGEADYTFGNSNFYNVGGAVPLFTPFNINTNAFIVGGSIGYNHQINKIVLGIENSYFGTDLKKSITSPFFPATDVYTSNISNLASLRARLGYGCDKWLVNVNAGAAFIRNSINFNDPTRLLKVSSPTTWNAGWVVGVGVDRKITPHFSVGAGYEYNQADTKIVTPPIGLNRTSPVANATLTVQSVMARINYHFS